MGNLRYDAEYLEVIRPTLSQQKVIYTDPLECRAFGDEVLGARFAESNPAPGVTCTELTIPGLPAELALGDGAQQQPNVTLFRYDPPPSAAPPPPPLSAATVDPETAASETAVDVTSGSPAATPPYPAILYVHGGGLIAGNVRTVSGFLAARYCFDTGLPVFAVEYRLAPEHPFPAALDDVYAALVYLNLHAETLGIDAGRIIVWGGSAGGGLAAAAALRARDLLREASVTAGGGISSETVAMVVPRIAKLLLIAPMLDDRTALPDDDAELEPFLTWTTALNRLGWGAYLGGKPPKEGDGAASASYYAAPGRAEDLRDMPRTYAEVGGLDLFRDETVRFVERLARENVDVEFHLYPGVPHGFDSPAPDIWVSKRARENRMRAIKDV